VPNHFELAVFSLLWSEHCGYKHSAILLKRLPTEGERVLQGPGENAGVVDLGEGEALAFKVESHNHPSAVEPFQGAATGVGGILRDIYAMGARPVALLDGLYFGRDDLLFEGAVAGIGTYGNCVGVPNVGGATFFDEHYAGNCLVNAMCVGLLPVEQLTSAKASGVGSVVMFGATTGRDGIGGASVLASQELGEDDADKRPSVQVGDPFTGKKLIEVSIELIEKNLVESLQDCGAAGLASALSEMASTFGLDIHLDRVPLRQDDLEPWEIMISESQERMVASITPSLVPAVKEVCERWELPCTEIGTITDTGVMRCFWKGEIVGDIPARFLTADTPRYELELAPRPKQDSPPTPIGPPFRQALLELLASDNIRDRSWVFERYDYIVGSRTVRRPGLDAGVLRLRPSMRGLALTLDGNGRIAWLDPKIGGAQAVLEAARNVACSGGEPLAITNCLNFGNPEKPEMAWELSEAIDGMADACKALGIPVVSGNVSLYNETDGQPIYPTPVVGCVGLVPDVRELSGAWREGDAVLLAGDPAKMSIAGSELQAMYDTVQGAPAELDLEAEAALVRFLWKNNRLFSIAHDVAEGGLAVCLAECAIFSGAGAKVDLPADPVQLFGECAGLAVVACAPEDVSRIEADGVPLREIGRAGGDSLNGISLRDLARSWQAEGEPPDMSSQGN
jgi:phosphoribosylformylglycinamidine synthase II